MGNIPYINYLGDPEKYMKTVREEWKKFIGAGVTEGLSVRNEVLDSWIKSLENGLSFGGTGAEIVLDEKMMHKINVKNTMLLQAAESVMDEFADMFRKRGLYGGVINLCNEDTVILRMISCGALGAQYAEDQQILPGAILDEKHTGTTCVSLARTTNQAYALYGPEHFRQSARMSSCAAAPITNIRNNQLKGIIALSGESFEIVPDTIGLVTFIARTIESNLLLHYIQNENALLTRFRQLLKDGYADLIVAVDTDMSVIASSSNVHPMLHNALTVKKLEKTLSSAAKKIGDAYMYAPYTERPCEFTVKEIGHYYIEFRPVYRSETYIGMTLSVRDMNSDKRGAVQGAQAESRLKKTIVGRNPAMISAINTAISVAPTDAPVLLFGETGCGKEVLARLIFEHSNRADKPFIAINCGALPTELIGSELFGYAGGAFTGASAKGSIGKLEAANGGTIFLDELGSMPLDAQSYLLRVIEENELYRLGSAKPIPINVRIICATNENLPDLIETKQFRLDLYYRLDVVEIKIPPLRERTDDLAELIDSFSVRYTGSTCSLSGDDIAMIAQYDWPGNVRELMNVVYSASVLKTDPAGALKQYVAAHRRTDCLPARTAVHEASEMERVVQACDGNIAKAARELGVARSTIYRRIKRGYS